MIKTQNLTKIFQTDEIETSALNEVNFNVEKGEFVAIMGPSGCGKSTLLEIGGAKIDELFSICDALKGRINESQIMQLNLADALVDGAVG